MSRSRVLGIWKQFAQPTNPVITTTTTRKMASEQPHHTMSKYLQQNQNRIFENNRAWVASKLKEDNTFFDKLSSGQQPDYL